VVTPEVEPEAVVRNSVSVIAAALLPGAVVGTPRTGARLSETAMHLSLVLWNAARVDAAIGRFRGLDAGMIDAAVGLLRPWRRFTSRLLMLLLCGLRLLTLLRLFGRRCLLLTLLRLLGCRLLLLMLLLYGLRLLMLLLPLLRFALLLFLLIPLCVARSNGS